MTLDLDLLAEQGVFVEEASSIKAIFRMPSDVGDIDASQELLIDQGSVREQFYSYSNHEVPFLDLLTRMFFKGGGFFTPLLLLPGPPLTRRFLRTPRAPDPGICGIAFCGGRRKSDCWLPLQAVPALQLSQIRILVGSGDEKPLSHFRQGIFFFFSALGGRAMYSFVDITPTFMEAQRPDGFTKPPDRQGHSNPYFYRAKESGKSPNQRGK